MSAALDLKTKEEKDAELDRRIEALRKKNEALVRRYQEIEEDKKRAEQEGIAVTTSLRKPRPPEAEPEHRRAEKESLTVTVDLSKAPGQEKRVISDRKPVSPRGRGQDGEFAADPPRSPPGQSPPRRAGSGRLSRGPRGGSGGGGGGVYYERREPRREKGEPRQDREAGEGAGRPEHTPRGRRGRGGGPVGPGPDRKTKEWEEKRRQNIEKMNEEMEKIAEYERGQRGEGQGEKNPIRNFLDDPRRCGPVPDADRDRKEGSRRHVRNWGGLDFDNVRTSPEWDKEWTSRRPGPKGSVDMTLSMTGRERAEYLRWKKEREQIDQERLARHRNATGQWRREWDAQKADAMFKEDAAVTGVPTADQGGRKAGGRCCRAQGWARASDDAKRPPKAPLLGDFLSQARSKEPGRSRGRGKGRAQGKSYSMHDDRWEDDKPEKEEKKEETAPKKKPEPKDPNVSTKSAPEVTGQEEDEEGWEDTSDGAEEIVGEVSEEEEEEEDVEEVEQEEKSSPAASIPAKPLETPHLSSPSGSPRGRQHALLPKVHIPEPQDPQSFQSPEAKPLSPFSPLEGHEPVRDWGEEMEMQSPRSSLGESPLKPDATPEGSPGPQNPAGPPDGTPVPTTAEAEDPEPSAQTEQDSGRPEPQDIPAATDGQTRVQESPGSPGGQGEQGAEHPKTTKEAGDLPVSEPPSCPPSSQADPGAVLPDSDQTSDPTSSAGPGSAEEPGQPASGTLFTPPTY
ncbi:coiled-coil domain-containing protein 9 isoform X2 [Lepisosteus oculatus]|uniref:coiled-coil domain-containing protein 9 isoform X2 n=1 Tax=Lepisosteus oculatus TaxID=7918 RepID=UPI00372122DB